MSDPYCPPNGSYTAPLYWQYPPPFQNPITAPQPPPQMPPRPAQFPPAGQYPQPQIAQRPQRALAPRDRDKGETFPLRKLLLNEEVMVNLQTRGWVMGIVLATVKLANAIAGWGYRVRFTPPGENFVEVDTFPHHSDSIRLP